MRQPESARRKPLAALLCATVFGVGYAPVAPGTFGSVAGLVLWAALPPSALVQSFAVVVLVALGAWSASSVERYYRAVDPGPVVVDEVAGMLLTMLWNPVNWISATGGFLLFRLFDIVKPYPARRFEKLHGGIGVMADDLMAAVYANLALRGILALIQ